MASLVELAARLVGRARPGEQLEVFAERGRDTTVRAYEGKVESFSSAESQGVGVRVVSGHRQGFAYAGSLEEHLLHQALDEARDNATFGTPDDHLGLAEPDGIAPAPLDLYRGELADTPTATKIELALELEAATRAADRRIVGIESAEYVDAVQEMAVVSTSGIRAATRETGCYLSVSTLATEGDDTQVGYAWSLGRHPGELDVASTAEQAARRATRLLGATQPPSERLTVVLSPWVTAQFLGVLGATLSGEMVLKGRSLFADRIGEEVASPLVTLIDDPTTPEAFTASTHDGEGLATRRNVLVEDGVLSTFVHNAYTARRFGVRSTGSAVRGGYATTPGTGVQAVALRPGTASAADLIASVDRGVLIQEVSGLHSGVNPVSGDFSTGAEGLLIRGGELADPVREVTIASTIQRMLRDVVAVGGDLEWLPLNAAGVSLVVADVTMSGA